MFSPLPFAWFLMHPFTVLVLTQPVRFFSPFPDSLPQLFLRCLLPTSVFRIFRFTSTFFRPSSFHFRLLSFLFLPFCSSRCHLTDVFSMHPFHSHFQDLPVTLCLISHASLHGSLTRLYWWFPFVLPWFTPAAVPQVIPFWISSWGLLLDFSFLSSASVLATHYLASVSSVPFLPVSVSQRLPQCLSSAFASYFFLILSCLISHAFFPDSRTWLPVCFLSHFPDSLPQLFLRWFPCAFAFGTFRFHFTFFRPCPFRFWLLGFLFLPFSSSWLCLTVAFPMFRFFLSALPLSTLSSIWFLILLFRFLILGFLFVSFHPSLFHSHSCSTSASLLFRFLSSTSLPGFSASFRLSFVRLGRLLITQLSDLSFPFFSISPVSGSFDACLPHPSSLFPCFPSDCGTQLPAIPFSDHCFVSQVLLQCLSFFLTEVSWISLAYALGFG